MKRTVRLDAICERIDYGFTASADFSVKEPRFLRITDIQEGSVDWNHVPGCRITQEEEADKRLCPGDIVFARTGATTGKCFLIRHAPRAVFASYLIRLRATDEVFPHYLYAFFQSEDYWHQIKGAVRGAAQGGVNSTTLSSLVLPLPDLTEQRRIAGQVEQADRLRRARRYALELTDTFLPAAFLELFGDPLSLMRRWDRRPFGELLADGLRNGLSPSSAGTVTARVLTLSAITRGVYDSSSSKLAPFIAEPPDEKRVCSLDFLICRGNGNLGMVGRGRFPPHDAPGCVFPDTMIAARVKPEMICKPFLEAVWESPVLRKQIEASARTTNGTHKINQGVIEELEIPLPPLPLQQKFAALVEGVERLRAVQREALRQAEHLFASLLDRAFSG